MHLLQKEVFMKINYGVGNFVISKKVSESKLENANPDSLSRTNEGNTKISEPSLSIVGGNNSDGDGPFSKLDKIVQLEPEVRMDLVNEFKESIINQSNRIFEDYRSFYTSGLNRILEVLFVSFIFSKNKKYEKILIWPSSGLGYPFKNYTRSIEFPNNCYIVSRCLNLISHLEYKERKRGIFFEKDTRNNHLSHSNHVILADEIFNYLTKNEYPNLSNFEKYFI